MDKGCGALKESPHAKEHALLYHAPMILKLSEVGNKLTDFIRFHAIKLIVRELSYF